MALKNAEDLGGFGARLMELMREEGLEDVSRFSAVLCDRFGESLLRENRDTGNGKKNEKKEKGKEKGDTGRADQYGARTGKGGKATGKEDNRREKDLQAVRRRVQNHLNSVDGGSVSVRYLMAYGSLFGVSVDWLLGLTPVRSRDPDMQGLCEKTQLSETALERLMQPREQAFTADMYAEWWSRCWESELIYRLPELWFDLCECRRDERETGETVSELEKTLPADAEAWGRQGFRDFQSVLDGRRKLFRLRMELEKRRTEELGIRGEVSRVTGNFMEELVQREESVHRENSDGLGFRERFRQRIDAAFAQQMRETLDWGTMGLPEKYRDLREPVLELMERVRTGKIDGKTENTELAREVRNVADRLTAAVWERMDPEVRGDVGVALVQAVASAPEDVRQAVDVILGRCKVLSMDRLLAAAAAVADYLM